MFEEILTQVEHRRITFLSLKFSFFFNFGNVKRARVEEERSNGMVSDKMGSSQRQGMRIRCEDENEGLRENPNLYWVDDDDDYSGQLESTNNIIIGERKPGIIMKDQYQAQLEDQRVDRRSCLSMIRSWQQQQYAQHAAFSLLPVPQGDHHVFQLSSNHPFLLHHDQLQQHQHLFSAPEDEPHFLDLQVHFHAY